MSKYDDIINITYQKSKTHPHMSISDRAAQFAPFAALTGYDEAIKEISRHTQKQRELGDDEKDLINKQIFFLYNNKTYNEPVTICYFIKDLKKQGGKYITVTDIIKKIDIDKLQIVLNDKTIVPFIDIVEIKADCFKMYD